MYLADRGKIKLKVIAIQLKYSLAGAICDAMEDLLANPSEELDERIRMSIWACVYNTIAGKLNSSTKETIKLKLSLHEAIAFQQLLMCIEAHESYRVSLDMISTAIDRWSI